MTGEARSNTINNNLHKCLISLNIDHIYNLHAGEHQANDKIAIYDRSRYITAIGNRK